MLNIMITVVLFLFVVISLPWFKHLLPLTPEKAALISPETPIKATQYLLEHKLPNPGLSRYALWKLPDLGSPTCI